MLKFGLKPIKFEKISQGDVKGISATIADGGR
jgi:hypothetical protein